MNFSKSREGAEARALRRKWQIAGACIATASVTWLTFAGQWVLLYGKFVPANLMMPVGILWNLIIVAPTQMISRWVGWRWGEIDSLSTAQFVAVLLVNAVLWGFIGRVFGPWIFAPFRTGLKQ
jgi:hypothetical protein